VIVPVHSCDGFRSTTFWVVGVHIAFFNRSYYPDTTATGQLLTDLCEGLVHEYNCRVTVVASSRAGGDGRTRDTVVQREQHNGVSVFRAHGTAFSKARFAGRATNYVTYFLSACLAALQLQKPDVVVALTDPPIIGLAGLLAARRFRAPFVMLFQDIFPEVARVLEDFHSETLNRLLHGITCFLVRRTAVNVAIGETMRRRLIEGKGADADRTTVITNWADCSVVMPETKHNAFSLETGLSEYFVVMHSGNIGFSQGLEHLVSAAALLQEHEDIRIAFVGDGARKHTLMQETETTKLRNVVFLPFVPKDRLAESFATADVFIISLKKGLAGYIVPSKLYGILAAGRPYVAAVETDSEVAAVSRQYGCGLVVDPENPDALAAGILTLYRDRELAKRMGEQARRAGLQFDRSAQLRAYFELFRRLSPRA
jgi:colanic acid biosynthesis glycosyl transferase WcaI